MALPSSLAGGKKQRRNIMKKITHKDCFTMEQIKALEVGQTLDNGVFRVERKNEPDFEYCYEVGVYSFGESLFHLKTCFDRFEVVYIMDTFIWGVFYATYGKYEYDKEEK